MILLIVDRNLRYMVYYAIIVCTFPISM